jgi:uroporphyrinogen-III decarboxylase
LATDLSRKNAERTRIAEKLGQPDEVPFGADALGTFVCGVAHVNLKEYYAKPEVMFTAQQTVRKLLYDIPSLAVDLGVAVEPSILGAQPIWREDEAPIFTPMMKNIEEVERLELLDVKSAPMLGKAYETWSYLSEKSGETVAWNSVLGPVDIACLIRGVGEFMAELHTKPEPARKLLKKATEACVEVVKHKLDLLEPLERFELADDYAGYLSPKVFEETYVPIAQEIYRLLPRKIVRWFHSDGDHIGPSVHLLPKAGAEVFHSFTPKIHLDELKKRIGDRVCISGNIDTIQVLRYGTPVDVIKACGDAIRSAGQNGGYILASGGELVRGTPIENVHAMLLAAAEYGKYPLEKS